MAECAEQIDIVEISVAGEAVGQVVAGVDGGEQFAAARAEEDESSVAEFSKAAYGSRAAMVAARDQIVRMPPAWQSLAEKLKYSVTIRDRMCVERNLVVFTAIDGNAFTERSYQQGLTLFSGD